MFARIELEYRAEEVIKKLSRPELAQLQAALPSIALPGPDASFEGWRLDWNSREQTVDLSTTGPVLIGLGLEFTIKRFTSCYRVAEPERAPGQQTVTNIQVAIPNLLLFAVDEVRLLENGCTDELQRMLEDGWRILAVCPPPAQRRPDYILGRQKGLH
jgi:hypothetical protein